MTIEQKKEFTRRIAQGNSTELIIVLYDMTLVYIDDALEQFDKDEKQCALELSRAKNCLDEMISNLHFEVELAKNFHQIYLSMKKAIREGLAEKNKEKIVSVKNNLMKLKEAYEQIVSSDQGGPVMSNTQDVVAGLTYGKTDVNENLKDDGNRGFLV